MSDAPAHATPAAPSMARRVLRTAIRVIAASAFSAVLLLVGCLHLFQRKIIYFPRSYVYSEELEFVNLGGEVIKYTSQGNAMEAYLLTGPEAGENDPIYFTFNGNAGQALGWMRFARGMQRADPRTTWLLVEYPGYGLSEGEPSRETIMAAAGDAREALRAKLGITSEELATRTRTIGHSMGAATGAEFASTYGASEVVMISPFTSLYDMAKRQVTPLLAFLVRDRWDNEARLAELAKQTPRPRVVIYHGEADSIVPAKMSRKLAAEYEGWIEYVEFPGIDHNDIIEPAGEHYGTGLKNRYENQN